MGQSLYAVRFSANGTRLLTAVVDDQLQTFRYDPRPSVTRLADGNLWFAWEERGEDNQSYARARQYSPDLVPAGPAFDVAKFGYAPQIAAAGDTVAFVYQTVPGYDLYTQVLRRNDRPVAATVPPLALRQDGGTTTVDLTAYFSDRETAVAALTYSLVSVTGTNGLFSAVTVDASRRLVLTPAAGKTGSATVVVRAADANGAFAEATFHVTVLPATAPTVVAADGLATGLDFGRLNVGTSTLRLLFSRDVVGAGTAANYELRRAGSNGLLEADDALLPVSVAYDSAARTATLTFDFLVEDIYRLMIRDAIADQFGVALGGARTFDFVAVPDPFTNEPPVKELLTPGGYRFDVQRYGIGSGQLVHGTRDAFDGLNRLTINGTALDTYYGSESIRPHSWQSYTNYVSQLYAQRNVSVPLIGDVDFARTVDTFDVPGGWQPRDVAATYTSNLGAGQSIVSTSDGDAVLETTDTWFLTDDGDGTGSPAVLHLIGTPLGVRSSSVMVVGDNVTWTYSFTVASGAVLRLATFTIVAETRAAAVAAVEELVGPHGFRGAAAEGLAAGEVSSLANFRFPAPPPPNRQPTAIEFLTGGSIPEDSPAETVVGVLKAIDPDASDSHDFELLDDADGRFYLDGSTVLVADGADLSYVSGTAHVIRVRATDTEGLAFEQNLTVSVTHVNRLPVAALDRIAMVQDHLGKVVPVLANDYDSDGGTLSVTSVTQPSHGSVQFVGGIVTYTPSAGYSGSDSFTYLLSDGQGGSATGTVRVTVAAQPTASNQAAILSSTVDAAIQRFAAAGLSAAGIDYLRTKSFAFADLDGDALAKVLGNTILLDRDADGQLWFVDSTPLLDEEFGATSSAAKLLAQEGTAAAELLDLETVVLREMAKTLGVPPSMSPDLLASDITAGVRYLPKLDGSFQLKPNAAWSAVDIEQLSALRLQYGFVSGGGKWFLDRSGQWYSISANGELRKYGVNTLIATLSPLVFDDPSLLTTGHGRSRMLRRHSSANFALAHGFVSGGGKWFQDRNNQWHLINPDGTLRKPAARISWSLR
ncbi:MAG: Ig-like domain-containing protein [Gemmataceae bacterium]